MKNKTKYRVYYSDTDHGRVMYYSNALKLFEIGRTEYLRQFAKPFSEYEKDGYGSMVVEAHVDYKNPVRYDDELTIETDLTEVGNSSMKFANKIYCSGELKIEGYCILVFLKLDENGNFAKSNVPDKMRRLVK